MGDNRARIIRISGPGVMREGKVGAALDPGTIVKGTSAGFSAETNANTPDVMVLCENGQLGGGVDTEYASGDVAKVLVAGPGTRCYLRVAARAPAIAAGDDLAKASGGTVAKTSTVANRCARAIEALNNSSSATTALVLAEVY